MEACYILQASWLLRISRNVFKVWIKVFLQWQTIRLQVFTFVMAKRTEKLLLPLLTSVITTSPTSPHIIIYTTRSFTSLHHLQDRPLLAQQAFPGSSVRPHAQLCIWTSSLLRYCPSHLSSTPLMGKEQVPGTMNWLSMYCFTVLRNLPRTMKDLDGAGYMARYHCRYSVHVCD